MLQNPMINSRPLHVTKLLEGETSSDPTRVLYFDLSDLDED